MIKKVNKINQIDGKNRIKHLIVPALTATGYPQCLILFFLPFFIFRW